MSDKVLDRHGRWRSLTIAFRISPEENAELNERVKLSGLTKQEYIINRSPARNSNRYPAETSPVSSQVGSSTDEGTAGRLCDRDHESFVLCYDDFDDVA